MSWNQSLNSARKLAMSCLARSQTIRLGKEHIPEERIAQGAMSMSGHAIEIGVPNRSSKKTVSTTEGNSHHISHVDQHALIYTVDFLPTCFRLRGRVLLALLDLCLGPPIAPTAPLLWFLKSQPDLSVPAARRSSESSERLKVDQR